MFANLLCLLTIYQLSVAVEYDNCGGSPLSDFCKTITWKYNYTCSYVASTYNLSISDLVSFNWAASHYLQKSDNYYCSMFTEGDQVCVTKPDYSDCGAYPFCVFEYPEYFCDSYTLDQDYITCQEICAMHNISMEEFKEWNKHNELLLQCWDHKWMVMGDTYCVSKPNITDFTDCVGIAEAENNPTRVEYYENLNTETVRPLYIPTSSSSIGSSATRSISDLAASSSEVQYKNCGNLRLKDYCQSIIWHDNYNCSFIARSYGLSMTEFINFNWVVTDGSYYPDAYYCSLFSEGDDVCLTEPDFGDCGSYPVCKFQHPEYFCDYVTIEEDDITCEEICEEYNITMEDFKVWNRHNYIKLFCGDDYSISEGDKYCVSKPNITDFTDCVSIAVAENNPSQVSYYEDRSTETIGPFRTRTSSSSSTSSSTSSAEVEYDNCGGSPLSDFCQTITWHNNYNCSSIAGKYNLTVSQLVRYNWKVDSYSDYSDIYYCSMFTEGDIVCVTEPDYKNCGRYPPCVFDYPEYFCDSYTIDKGYVTCQEICDMFNITMEEFKDWNKHNSFETRCWDQEWMGEGYSYCVSKPNITDFTDCVSIAVADHNPYNVEYFEEYDYDYIRPFQTSTSSSSTTRSSTRSSYSSSTPSVIYENCGGSPVSDFCESITWSYNDTCESVADKYGLTINELVRFNWVLGDYMYYSYYKYYSSYSDMFFCSMFTEGDHVCITEPGYNDCGDFPWCEFDYPEYFCETYTIDGDFITCRYICEMFNITLEEFKEWNRHNRHTPYCWDRTSFLEGEKYCVSKPNITDFTDCVSIAAAEHNPSNVAMYESSSSETIGPMHTSRTSSTTRTSFTTTSSLTSSEATFDDREYINCDLVPLSDLCEAITWKGNDTCSSITSKYNITLNEFYHFNLLYDGYIDYFEINYCDWLTEGDHVCISPRDLSVCGTYPSCTFENPEYFCDTYTVNRDNITCQEICEINNISMEEFKEWNIFNDFSVRCWDKSWISKYDTFCVSKPNITNLTDCMSIAIAEHNPWKIENLETIGTQPVTQLYPDNVIDYFEGTDIITTTAFD